MNASALNPGMFTILPPLKNRLVHGPRPRPIKANAARTIYRRYTCTPWTAPNLPAWSNLGPNIGCSHEELGGGHAILGSAFIKRVLSGKSGHMHGVHLVSPLIWLGLTVVVR